VIAAPLCGEKPSWHGAACCSRPGATGLVRDGGKRRDAEARAPAVKASALGRRDEKNAFRGPRGSMETLSAGLWITGGHVSWIAAAQTAGIVIHAGGENRAGGQGGALNGRLGRGGGPRGRRVQVFGHVRPLYTTATAHRPRLY